MPFAKAMYIFAEAALALKNSRVLFTRCTASAVGYKAIAVSLCVSNANENDGSFVGMSKPRRLWASVEKDSCVITEFDSQARK